MKVNVGVVVTAGSERLGDVDEATELGEVAMYEEEAACVDVSGSVVLATASAFTKSPKIGLKSKLSQHPASILSGPSSCGPQHQLVVWEPLFIGQGYRLLKLLTAAIIRSARSLWVVSDFWGRADCVQSLHPGQQYGDCHVTSVHPPR